MNPLFCFNASNRRAMDDLILFIPDKFQKIDIVIPNQDHQEQIISSQKHTLKKKTFNNFLQKILTQKIVLQILPTMIKCLTTKLLSPLTIHVLCFILNLKVFKCRKFKPLLKAILPISQICAILLISWTCLRKKFSSICKRNKWQLEWKA